MLASLMTRLESALLWVKDWLLSPETLVQLGAILLSGFLAFAADRILRPWAWRVFKTVPFLEKTAHVLAPLFLPFLWLVIAAGVLALCRASGLPTDVLEPVARLLTAWLLIRGASLFIGNPDLARLFAVTAWIVAALKISGALDPSVEILDSAAIHVGETRISLLLIITGLLTFGVMIWFAMFASRLIEQSLARFPTLTPSGHVLMGKLVRTVLVTLAILLAMTSLGIDLTALALVGGVVGVGIGFGLQKVVSNLISGVILLLDNSVKPGDVIEVGDSYGWINKLAARYTSVITRDGREHLIPNEDMITQTVINWTYSSTVVRRHIPIRLSYKADLHLAIGLVVKAAAGIRRVLEDPKPVCLVKDFDESAIQLELRLWIADPHNGVRNVASEVLLAVWDQFREHGIEFPHPQQDLHIISAEGLEKLVQTIVARNES